MDNYVSLHNHSEFSPQDGIATCDQLAARAAELGMSALALTDHGRAGGLLKHKQACQKAGIKPIYGAELYIAPTSRLLKEKIDGHRTSYHITLLAKNSQGFENILRLTSLGWLEGYYYKPRCLVAGQEIYTQEGIKPIENIKIGDYILTHKGRFRPVTNITTNHYNGLLYGVELNNKYGRITWLTDDHPVLIYNQHTAKQEWVKAKNIIAGRTNKQIQMSSWTSFVCLPKVQTNNQINNIQAADIIKNNDWILSHNNTFKKYYYEKDGVPSTIATSYLLNNIKLDYNFGFFLGLYIAEGCWDKNEVGLSFHRKEKNLIDAACNSIKQLTNRKATLNYRQDKPGYKGVTVRISSTPLACLLDILCGHLAYNKHFPWFTFNAPKEFQIGLYNGVIAGDGAVHPTVSIFTQTSKTLAWQMRLLAATYTNSFPSVKEYNDKNPNHRLQYRTNFSNCNHKYTYRKILFDDKYVYRPISNIKTKSYSGLVYNIEVAEDNSYVSDFAMHNCDLELLTKYKEGLVVLSGCAVGTLSYLIMENHGEDAIQYANQMRKLFGDDFYIEVQNHGLDFQSTLKTALFVLSKHLNIPIVATQDVHYIHSKDSELHKHICKLVAGDLEFETDQVYFKSYEDLATMFEPEERHALDRTTEVADKCNVEWKHDKTIWPCIQLDDTPEAVLRRKTYEGLTRIARADSQLYRDRIEEELRVIETMGFATYFLVVADLIAYAKNQGIPTGPGRGSAVGSCVCYALGITEVDPIQYGLFFTRFLNESRVSLPDVDIDFCRDRRDEIIQYIKDKYGNDYVAQIGTYSEFRPRGSLRDFARVCGYDVGVGEKLAKLIPPDIAGKPLTFDEAIKDEPKLLKTDTPEVVALARQAEGLRKQAGVHAGGIVIADRELLSVCPLFRGRSNEVATQFDMYDIEAIGLVKFDFLGLKNLTVIHKTIELLKKTQGIDIVIQEIPEDDQQVFTHIFKKGDLDGVFQFETSTGFRDLCVKIRPESIYDLACITSLFRPGPLGAGLADQYIRGRNGGHVDYLTPELQPILKETYGAIIFQEQLMRVCTDVAGYTPAEADNMRKIVGKKLPDKMKAEREKFVQGCVETGLSKHVATKLFVDIENYALYSFNLSHAVAYSVISYRTAWLKHHYPVEFYTALLNCSFGNQEDLIKYIYSAREHEISIEPPDINRSQPAFAIDNGTILFGFAGVKGLGEKACQEFVEARPEEGFRSLEDIINAGINLGTIRTLAECGSLVNVTDVPYEQLVNNIDVLVEYYRKLARHNNRLKRIAAREAEIEAAVNAGHKPPRRLPKPKTAPQIPTLVTGTEEIDGLALERKTLGFYLTGHPLDKYPALVNAAQSNISRIQSGELTDGNRVRVPVVIAGIIPKRTKKGHNYGILMVEDKTGRMEATIFPRQWNKLKDNLHEEAVVTMVGTVRYTLLDDDVPPLARIIVMDIQQTNANQAVSMHDIVLPLRDGSKVVFKLGDTTNFSLWQQALGLVHNLEKVKNYG